VEFELQWVRAQSHDTLDVRLNTVHQLPEDHLARCLVCVDVLQISVASSCDGTLHISTALLDRNTRAWEEASWIAKRQHHRSPQGVVRYTLDLIGSNTEADHITFAIIAGRVVHQLLDHVLDRIHRRLPKHPETIRDMAMEELHPQRTLFHCDHTLVVSFLFRHRVYQTVYHLPCTLAGINVLLDTLACRIDGHGSCQIAGPVSYDHV